VVTAKGWNQCADIRRRPCHQQRNAEQHQSNPVPREAHSVDGRRTFEQREEALLYVGETGLSWPTTSTPPPKINRPLAGGVAAGSSAVFMADILIIFFDGPKNSPNSLHHDCSTCHQCTTRINAFILPLHCIISYTIRFMTPKSKPIWWAGSSKDELLSFSDNAIQNAGYQLHRLQMGHQPQDWKPLGGLGKGITGVYEIRIWDDGRSFRVAYVSKFDAYVVILHCWQKNSPVTAMINKNIIVNRFKTARERLK